MHGRRGKTQIPIKSSILAAAGTCGKGLAPEQAFALIDLLALMLAVALFTMLLLPALAKSNDNGRRTVCTNNLRQMGAASTMYANDNQDYLAYPNWGYEVPGWLYTITNGGTIPDPSPTGTYSNNQVAAYSPGLWFQYVQNPNTYLCPVDLESKYYALRINKLCSYVMNGAVCGFGGHTSPCKVTDVWNPACYLLWGSGENSIGPGNPGPYVFNDGANYPDYGEGVERIHTANGGEVLSVAGNVQFVGRQKWMTESGSLGPNLAWWSPFSSDGH
jgi:hypothetical protein